MVTASKPSHQLFLGSRIWASASVGTPQDTDLPKPSMRLTDLPSSSYPNATKHVYIYIYTRGTWSPRVHIYIYICQYMLVTWPPGRSGIYPCMTPPFFMSETPCHPPGPRGPRGPRPEGARGMEAQRWGQNGHCRNGRSTKLSVINESHTGMMFSPLQ